MPGETKLAFVFPGQGSQSVGMGREIYETFASARFIFQTADEVTGTSLSNFIFNGPETELLQTINTQPAIVTVSLALLKVLEELTGKAMPVPAFTAGHSLGEYAALAAAGVIDTKTAIFLVRQRGRLMFEAGQKKPGTMAAVLGLDESILSEICRETGAVIANANCPGQLTISGSVDSVSRAVDAVKAKGAKAIPLQVSGAFHSPLMRPAVEEFSRIISGIKFNAPRFPIVANVTATSLTSPEQIPAELTNQLQNGVQWQHSVEFMIANGVNTFIEIGPGKVLSGLIKRINKTVNTVNINDVNSLELFAENLKLKE
jgi:[acyl-carrier-protein] S-malonyltransferase